MTSGRGPAGQHFTCSREPSYSDSQFLCGVLNLPAMRAGTRCLQNSRSAVRPLIGSAHRNFQRMGPAHNHLTDLHPLPRSQFIQQDSNDPGVSQHPHMDNQSPSNPFHIKGRHGTDPNHFARAFALSSHFSVNRRVHGWEGPLHKRPQVIQRSFIIFSFLGEAQQAGKQKLHQGSFTSAGQCPSNVCRTIGDAPLKVTAQCLTGHLLAPR